MALVSKSKMEADISEAYIKFQWEILGRGPQETKTYILKDMVISSAEARVSEHDFVTLLVPEFIPRHWWHRMLHDQTSLRSKPGRCIAKTL